MQITQRQLDIERYATFICLGEWHKFQQAEPPSMHTPYGFYCVSQALGRRGKISHITVDDAQRAALLLDRWQKAHVNAFEALERERGVMKVKMYDLLPTEMFDDACYAIAYFEDLLYKNPYSFYLQSRPKPVEMDEEFWSRVRYGE